MKLSEIKKLQYTDWNYELCNKLVEGNYFRCFITGILSITVLFTPYFDGWIFIAFLSAHILLIGYISYYSIVVLKALKRLLQ